MWLKKQRSMSLSSCILKIFITKYYSKVQNNVFWYPTSFVRKKRKYIHSAHIKRNQWSQINWKKHYYLQGSQEWGRRDRGESRTSLNVSFHVLMLLETKIFIVKRKDTYLKWKVKFELKIAIRTHLYIYLMYLFPNCAY